MGRKLVIIGSSDFAERLITYIDDTSFADVVGLIDDFELTGSIKHNRPVLGKIFDLPELYHQNKFDMLLLGIGYKHMKFRQETFEYLEEMNLPIATFIHPSAHVEDSAIIGKGCIILVNCTVDIHSRLHDNVVLSSVSFVSHDVEIQAHTYCGPSLNLAGNTQIGERCFLGINTTTIDNVKIGDNVLTAAGSVITKNVPDNVLVAGVPATIKKRIDK